MRARQLLAVFQAGERLPQNHQDMAQLLAEVFGRKPKPQPLNNQPLPLASARGKMWTSMRIQRDFTAQSVAAASETEVQAVRKYIKALIAAGYVRLERQTSFEVGDHSAYSLLRNTGPYAPRVRSRGCAIYDVNLNQEVTRDD
ncbi:hypothetical protein ED208_12575 [Stagnimonas aquatica]|uniref:Uncharacterized protein n=1 Tax=Stagnimonas aquatica TaxID=2689987 RepID=A0A3N0V779_9GAMM|nr:hypothetical protein [Stagnimonas aquatica]ROH88647.1 hypothetical protein ED208_12575 [Stagnimonas aquatica]